MKHNTTGTVRPKKRPKVTSTHNSTLCRNTTLNSSVMKQTLKSNNRALAKRLEIIRYELAETQKALLKEKEEKQSWHQKYTELYKLVGLQDMELEVEIDRRMQIRMNHMKETLHSILGNVLSTVDLLQKCTSLCEPRVSRGSSLGPLGWGGQEEESPPGDRNVNAPKRSIYYHGPGVTAATQPAGTSHDAPHDTAVQEGEDAGRQREIPRDILHQALDVILEQSGLGESFLCTEEGGSRRNSKKSRPNSVTGSRRNSRRSSQLLGSVNRKSEEQPTKNTPNTEEPGPSDDLEVEGHQDDPVPLRGDDRPIVSKFAPHIQGTTPATSPVKVTPPVNQDSEEFYSRFIPLEEGGSSNNKSAATPKSSKSHIPVGRKNKKAEVQASSKPEEKSKSKKPSIAVSSRVSDENEVDDQMEDECVEQVQEQVTTESSDKSRDEDNLDGAIQDKPLSSGPKTEGSTERLKKKSEKEEITKRKQEQKNKEKTDKETSEEEINPEKVNTDQTTESKESGKFAPSLANKRGTFVLKKAPAMVEKVQELDEPQRKSEKAGRSRKSKKESQKAADKRGTFVIEKPVLVSEDSENEAQLTRKTARRVRRGTFAVQKDGGNEKSGDENDKVSAEKESKQARLRRGTFCLQKEKKSDKQEVEEEGILGEKLESLLLDTSVISQGPGIEVEEFSDECTGDDHSKIPRENNSEKEENEQKKSTDDESKSEDSSTDQDQPNNTGGKPQPLSDGIFKVPFPVVTTSSKMTTQQEVAGASQSSGTDHTICEEEEMEMTEILPCSFEGKVPLPPFITRENSMEPAFLKDVSLGETETGDKKEDEGEENGEMIERREEEESEDEDRIDRKEEVKKTKGRSKRRASIRLKGGKGQSDKRTKEKDETDEEKDQRIEKPEKGGTAVDKGNKVIDDDILGTDVEVVPKKKPRCDSESDSSDGGRVRKHFNTFVSKPGKIMFKSGRKDMAEISSAAKGKKNAYKSKSILPRATLKSTVSKQKGKLLPSTSPLNSSRVGLTKNVFDLSLNESIPVPSSISYGQFLEQKTLKDQGKNPNEDGKEGGAKSVNETVTEHGIMLVLGNGKRTKPRRQRSSKGVHYATELTEDHMITPAGDGRTESRKGGEAVDKAAAKKKEVVVKKSAGHTPPRKTLDSKQRRRLVDTITKSNQEVAAASSGDEDRDLSPRCEEKEDRKGDHGNSKRQMSVKVKGRRILSQPDTEDTESEEDGGHKVEETAASVTSPASDVAMTPKSRLNHSLFTAEDSTSDDQNRSPDRRLSSPRSPVVSLKRLNVHVTPEPKKCKSKSTNQRQPETPSGQNSEPRKSRRDSSVVRKLTRNGHIESETPSESPSPVKMKHRKSSKVGLTGHNQKEVIRQRTQSDSQDRGLSDNRGRKDSSSLKKRLHEPDEIGKLVKAKPQTMVSDSSDEDYSDASNRKKAKKKKVKKVKPAEKRERKRKVLVEESDDEDLVNRETPGGEKRKLERMESGQCEGYSSNEDDREKRVVPEDLRERAASVVEMEPDRVQETDEENEAEERVKINSEKKHQPSKGKRSKVTVEGRKTGKKPSSGAGIGGEGADSEEEGQQVPPRHKDKRQTKEKKQRSATIPLPVELDQIKDELRSFIEDHENQEEEYANRQQQEESSPCTGRRSRRAAGAVSYKEPSLTSKLRRGDSIAQTVYSGKDAPRIFKGKKDAKKSGGRPSTSERKRSTLMAIGNTLTEN